MNGPAAALLSELDALLLALCRVSAFLAVLPGFSSIRVPARVRAFIALGLAMALAPLAGGNAVAGPAAVFNETVTGAALGLIVRMVFLAFGFAASAIATYAGIAAMPGTPIETEEAHSPLAALITLTATALVLAAGLHAQLIAGLAASFEAIPPGTRPDPALLAARGIEAASDGFLLALRLSMPFLVFSVVVNLSIGLANKMSPQIPVYFISMPFVAAGGLAVSWALLPEMLAAFMAAVRDLLLTGWM